MRVNILFEFKEGPWGGGNQFLKALKDAFAELGVYANKPEEADCILFNSHHMFDEIIQIKKQYKEKIFIHRIDGPIFFIRNRDLYIDKKIFCFNEAIADATVFQSKWSLKKCESLGYKKKEFETVIYNAPDIKIFNDIGSQGKIVNKVKIIATSWSDNIRKGFNMYKYLDENLDFNKYSVTFVGNSPFQFNNIKMIPPVNSYELSKILRQHNIYLTASMNDPCSNALIEALNCGLPAVVLNDGGHPELIGAGGIVFDSDNDVIEKIEKVVQDYSSFKSNIEKRNINKVATEYLDLMQRTYKAYICGTLSLKKVSSLDIMKWKSNTIIYKIKNKLNGF